MDGIWPWALPLPVRVLLPHAELQTPSSSYGAAPFRHGCGGVSLFLHLGGFVFRGGDDGQNIPCTLRARPSLLCFHFFNCLTR